MNIALCGLGEYCDGRRAQEARVTSRVQGWSASKVRCPTLLPNLVAKPLKSSISSRDSRPTFGPDSTFGLRKVVPTRRGQPKLDFRIYRKSIALKKSYNSRFQPINIAIRKVVREVTSDARWLKRTKEATSQCTRAL